MMLPEYMNRHESDIYNQFFEIRKIQLNPRFRIVSRSDYNTYSWLYGRVYSTFYVLESPEEPCDHILCFEGQGFMDYAVGQYGYAVISEPYVVTELRHEPVYR